ncbi:MAG: HypC/HybG/HupF family hydrogenase formation chaperone [Candidatus Carbobacillus altaicus]|uniref:[NiFe] hydrogenase metallocenter assembly protein HypC n=1 Tax=Candidatus Carbonibacillus altaicus TaxID=2163959 RepID=A0A2R6XZ50_9BACL|nr:HypC/HybG/HupF family hydrogenase formation chaperone [Candidatus Carbobacillus altaicus]PTQ55718.1 MAG: hypothetical protein BSOLF_1539 [Candidatus Carbobacillus altaicus]
MALKPREETLVFLNYGERTLSDDGCLTCGNVAVPVRVLKVQGNVAEVEDRLGERTTVALDFVPDARVGEMLLIHLGIALGRAQEVE